MSELPNVANVLLVATPERARELAPWLRVVGQPVRYALEVVAPCSANPRPDPAWGVIVVDGDSIATDAEREETLRRMTGQLFATMLYIAQHDASDPGIERDQAFVWASDLIWQGWEFGDRLRRRVQEIALAPWLRSMALRAEAERLGDRRLRVVRPVRTWEERDEQPTGRVRRLDRAVPFVIAEKAAKLGGAAHRLVASAFHEGRRVGVVSVRESADAFCALLLDELRRAYDDMTPEMMRELEASFYAETSHRVGGGSPLIAARFGGASYAAGLIRTELQRLVREEIAAIDRHDARPVCEP